MTITPSATTRGYFKRRRRRRRKNSSRKRRMRSKSKIMKRKKTKHTEISMLCKKLITLIIIIQLYTNHNNKINTI